MKKIRLLSLKLESFRGLANYELCPNGKNTVVTGANGTGKSTLAAAFLWLLTGKDDQGRADYNIFPLAPDGRRLSGCTPTVIAVLEVEGEQLVLQRSLAEKWTKRRGAAEAEYAGDESRFVVDEVPVSAGEYARRVEQLTAGDMLPLLTSAAWFSERTKDYKERRRLLLERFGGVSAGEVFDACPELQPLRQEMGRHSVEEYSRICADRRKRYKEELAALPARIDENRKQLIPDLDTAALRTRRGELNVEIAKLRYRIEHTDTSCEGQRIQDQLAALEVQLSLVPIKRRAMEQAENAGLDARHAKQLAAAMQEKAAAEFELRKTELELDAACKRLEDTVARRDELRAPAPNVRALESSGVEIVWNARPAELVQGEDGRLQALKVEDVHTGEVRELACDGVFAAIGRVPDTGLFREQVNCDAAGYFDADETTRTNLPGVYAVGDARAKAVRQVVTATADGAVAVHFAQEYLAGVEE